MEGPRCWVHASQVLHVDNRFPLIQSLSIEHRAIVDQLAKQLERRLSFVFVHEGHVEIIDEENDLLIPCWTIRMACPEDAGRGGEEGEGEGGEQEAEERGGEERGGGERRRTQRERKRQERGRERTIGMGRGRREEEQEEEERGGGGGGKEKHGEERREEGEEVRGDRG